MCFHASITSTSKQIELRFGAAFYNTKIKARFDNPNYHLNGFDHPDLPIITQELPDIILPAVWGIVPKNENPKELDNYYKKASKFGGGLNARSEKLTSHFLYRQLYNSQRCLILVNAFFEPHRFRNTSYPYLIKRKDSDLFALAGLYSRFDNGLLTCTILTKNAMPYLAEIHNLKKRQPVILPKASERQWVSNNLKDNEIFPLIDEDINENELMSYPVSKTLFSPKVDSNVPSILEHTPYPELNSLF